MKKLIILLVIVLGYTAVNAQSYVTPTATKQGTFTTKVIAPFLIQNDQGLNDTKLPDIVSGTTRTILPTDGDGGGLYIFKITKEKGYFVDFTFTGDNTVDGVTIDAKWWWTYQHPGTLLPPAYNAIPQGWWWGPGSDESDPVISGTNTVQVYAFLKVNTVGCPAGTLPGTRTFTVTASGQYRAL